MMSRRLLPHARQAFAERVARELGAAQTLLGADCDAYATQGQTPVVVARPAGAAGVAAALALAAEAGAAIVPWGGGSRQAMGYPPRRYDLALSLGQLTQIVHYDPADLTITVGVGMTHAALARTLAPARQSLPLDVPLPTRATLGGTLATGFAGLRRAFAGAPRDLTLGVRVSDAQGQSLAFGGRVVKNVTGYDMTKLHIGALGTLGVIVEASFKLAPLPETEETTLAVCESPAMALAAADALAALATRPSAVVAAPVATLPALAQLVPGHERRILLAARFPGVEAAVRRGMREAEQAFQRTGVMPLLTLDQSAQDDFWATANDALSPELVGSDETLLRLTTLPAQGAAALAMAEALAATHRLTLAWIADLASGALWLRLRPQDGAPITNASARQGLRAVAQAHAELQRHWGNIMTLACPLALKQPWTDDDDLSDAGDGSGAPLALWGAPPASIELMRAIREQYDPDERLNPGRYLADL